MFTLSKKKQLYINFLRLSEAEREKDIAQLEVVDRIREHEVVKLIRIKEGLFKVIIKF